MTPLKSLAKFIGMQSLQVGVGNKCRACEDGCDSEHLNLFGPPKTSAFVPLITQLARKQVFHGKNHIQRAQDGSGEYCERFISGGCLRSTSRVAQDRKCSVSDLQRLSRRRGDFVTGS